MSAGVIVAMFVSGFYIGGYAGCLVGGLSNLCYIYVTDVWRGLK